MRMRPHLAVLAVCIFTLLLSCNPSGPNKGHRLLIYTPHGQDLLRDFIARYKDRYTDVDVQFLDMGSREILERVRVERNRPQADLWWGAAHTTFQTAAEENLLAPFRPSWANSVPASARDGKDLWYGTYETPQVIVYNSDAVRVEDAPHDWDDVLDSKWRDKGHEWLRKLDANVHEYTADGTLLMQKLARREGLVSLWDMPDVRLFKEQKGLPVAYVVPASGTPVVTDGIAILRGAPNEEDARRFYEFVTTPESLLYSAKKYYRIPGRTDLDRAQLPAWMNEPFTRMPLNWDLLRKEGGEWLRYWDTEIRGRSTK